MEFHNAQQISPDKLKDFSYDIFILAAGYEQRSIYLPANYNIKAEIKIALAFNEKSKELHRKDNDSFLVKQGYKLVTISGEQNLDLEPYFTELLKSNGNRHMYMLVDYSSMTKMWYSGIINYLIGITKSHDYITIHFSYTPAVYNEPKKKSPVNINKLVSYPCKKVNDSAKPTALIIGLGLDNNRAEYIRKTQNPALTILFYADPTNDLKYVEKVFKYNQDLIEQTEVRNLYSFPLNDLEKTDEMLTSLCINLRVKYNIVIAPVGPKILSLLALLLASRYPDINVMRVSSGANLAVYDRIPCCKPLVYSVEFVSDELD
jgi:hypothetical protein